MKKREMIILKSEPKPDDRKKIQNTDDDEKYGSDTR